MRTVDQIDIWIFGLVLSGITGALLATGCEAQGDVRDLAAVPYREAAREERDSDRVEVADLGKAVAEADHSAGREIEQARKNANKMPVAARERLDAAIERVESARDEANDRLDDLKGSGNVGNDTMRQRVIDALDQLNAARHDVVAALAGGQPSLSEG